MSKIRFPALSPKQPSTAKVAVFVATASEIEMIAKIERLARSTEGVASGFQRPKVAAHIREIAAYLRADDAMLANSIVLGFVRGAELRTTKTGGNELVIDTSQGAPGLIVDGQQRFTALMDAKRSDFQVPVSAFICESVEELHSQFILINNTKPLPRGLIDELLPTAKHYPHRYSARGEASTLIEALNYKRGSSLRGMIQRQTNPDGVIADSSLGKLIKHSLSDGALRLYRHDPEQLSRVGVDLISEYFHAVRHVFRDAWDGHTPKTSRLLHGVGIVSMGFVMEYIHVATGATKREQFIGPLTALRSITAWTEGEWELGPERRRWNSLQNVSSEWKVLAYYLVRHVQQSLTPAKGKSADVRS